MHTLFDSHFHIIDTRFPIVPNHGFLPQPFTCEDYLKRIAPFHAVGGAVVSGSFQAFDQTYLLDALNVLGPNYVGVTQLRAETADAEIIRLNQRGVRAIRFNIRRGGSADISSLDYLSRRVYDLVGWHTELYIDSKGLSEIFETVRGLPKVSVDHLGLTKDGFPTLIALAEIGVRVKATGFGRVDLNVKEALRTLASANPDCLMFGTDLPSTRARRPFEDADIDIIYDTLDDKLAEKVMYRNAIAWYGLSSTPTR